MIASTEPLRITAGDTVAWTKALADYPASAGWVLRYRLINAAGKIDISGSAAGDAHAISASAAISATWPAGTYSFQAAVDRAGERYTVGTGTIVIAANLAAQAGGYENRSTARQILDGLLASYSKAVLSRAFVVEYEINGRRMKFNAKAEWLMEINYWKRETATEARSSRRAAGLDPSNKVYLSF